MSTTPKGEPRSLRCGGWLGLLSSANRRMKWAVIIMALALAVQCFGLWLKISARKSELPKQSTLQSR